MDLPIVPCYDSTHCDNIFNCGPSTSVAECPIPLSTPPSGTPQTSCPTSESHSPCFGQNSYYCSGINMICPDTNVDCALGKGNPQLTTYGNLIGCDVTTNSNCFEFDNDQTDQSQVSICQNNCWTLGGQKEVASVCENLFKDKNSCDAMKYFCTWDGMSCTSSLTDPVTVIKTLPIVSTEAIGPTGSDWTLECAQSSWSSTKQTSYVPSVRTCCLNKPGETKACVTTPRCQFVETSCECGFKDIDYSGNPNYNKVPPTSPINPWFMCQNTLTSVTTNTGGAVHTGYCTWCKGTMLEDFDYRTWLINNQKLPGYADIMEITEWGTPDECSNRCSSYNTCEINNSESDWNSCIWQQSGGVFGIDPSTPSINLTKGWCFNYNSCITEAGTNSAQVESCNNQLNLQNTCENQLASKYNTYNELFAWDVNTPGGALACTQGSKWTHVCSSSSGSGNFAENYVCGWCPSLTNEAGVSTCPPSTNPPSTNPPIMTSSPYISIEQAIEVLWPDTKINPQQRLANSITVLVVLIVITILIIGLIIWGIWKKVKGKR